MTANTRRVPRRKAAQHPPLGRQVWLDTARTALIEEGTAGIEINKLARRLGVSRGGFYWFFRSRQQLLDELLARGVMTSKALHARVLQSDRRDGMREYHALIDMWVNEEDYDPRWDGAVRDWARTSATVLKAVRAVDRQHIAVLRRIFLDMGFRGMEAQMRARITYYHQIGYYALGVRESRRTRRRLLPYYAKVLTGRGFR